MNAVTEQAIDQHKTGLYQKFDIRRTDGSSDEGGKHYGDDFFVLNLTTDRHAIPAIKAYANSCAEVYPQLAKDLRAKLRAMMPSEFVTVPETTVPDITLPDGTIIPSWVEPAFEISRYLATVDEDGIATIQADGTPTVNISYYDANKAADKAGLKVLRNRRSIALAWHLYAVGANWTSGEFGVGDLRQGLHKGSVDGPQSNDYVPEDPEEDRRFYLANGEIIFDPAGHLFTHIFDDIHGDENGIVAKPFAADSLTIAAPFKSLERGSGWRHTLPADWSGNALVRGGCWRSGGNSGVFHLNRWYPSGEYGSVGFRLTK